MQVEVEQLKRFIVDSGVLSSTDLQAIDADAKAKGVSLREALVTSGRISDDEMRRLEAYVLGIPFVSLKEEKVDLSVLSVIPEPIARKHNVVAFRKRPEGLEVAMLDPQDLESVEFIKKRSGLAILPRLTDKDSIKNVLLQYQKSLKAEFGEIIKKESINVPGAVPGAPSASEEDLKKLAEDLPIVRIVDTLLNHAMLQRASDIHLEPFETELVVRYRVDGILHDAMVLPKNLISGITARIKVLANLRLDEKRLPQDGRFKIEHQVEGSDTISRVSFRVSTLPTSFGEKIVLRLLPESSKGFSLEGAGFHGEGIERIHRAIKQTTGLILVTGPTGSGKSTTLYTLIDILNTPAVNISTIEDPVEYQIPRVSQTQVKPEIGLSFANGLRTLMRQDPNIIMVGEIRDSETANLAINASLTGHLVLSTLHTNSAAHAIPRLLDMKVEPFLLVSTLTVVIAQRLVRRLAKEREEYVLTKEEFTELARHADMDRVLEHLRNEKIVGEKDGWEAIKFCKPKPSKDSVDGYGGRAVISEVLFVSKSIREMVIRGATADDIGVQAKKEGMLSLVEDGIFQAARGITSIEEVLRVANEGV